MVPVITAGNCSVSGQVGKEYFAVPASFCARSKAQALSFITPSLSLSRLATSGRVETAGCDQQRAGNVMCHFAHPALRREALFSRTKAAASGAHSPLAAFRGWTGEKRCRPRPDPHKMVTAGVLPPRRPEPGKALAPKLMGTARVQGISRQHAAAGGLCLPA